MSVFRALYTYDEILREFYRHMSSPHDLEETLEDGLGFLSTRLKLESVSLYWWDRRKNALQMQYTLHDGTLMEGEEEIYVTPNTALAEMTKTLSPVISSKKNPWVAFIPLRSTDNELIGAVRLERKVPLPRAGVLYGLPQIIKRAENQPRNYPLLEDLADILSIRLAELFKDQLHRKKEQYLKAGTDVATAVVEAPRVRDMLETVARSIVRNLGFDRVRLYLTDESRYELSGIAGLQIPGRILNLDNEKFNLRDGVNALVDVALSGSNQVFKDPSGGRVVYVPLMVGGRVLGAMAVDNLLSQQEIDDDQMAALKTLAGQIGLAIVNARLFEDIEQQAITDGLTKLYVYRYFQQRLREEIDRADRYSYSVALVMMDVDYFKTINDSYGHQLGDQVLEFLAQTIRGNIRRIDLAARYGGDEFVLLLPEITEQETWMMGTRLLNALKNCDLRTPGGDRIPVAVTMGVALYPTDAANGRDLIGCADQALYWSKKNTRGDICFYKNIAGKVEQSA